MARRTDNRYPCARILVATPLMEPSVATSNPRPGKLALVIPAYRPAAELAGLVREVQARDEGRLFAHIVIVDDGSEAGHAPAFEAASLDGRVRVIRHAVNLGKGAALKTGFNHVLVAFPNIQGIVTADADGQHTAGDILRVGRALQDQPDRLVLGTRQFQGPVPARSRAGNLITRTVFRALTGIALDDTQTGLRGWPRAYCAECLRIPINGYDFELECLLAARGSAAARRPFLQVPIETIYADGNPSSHFNPLRDSMRIYFVFLRYCASACVAAVVDSLTFSLIYSGGGNMIWSQTWGRVAAVTVAFALARNVVFRAKEPVAVALAKYLLLVAVMGVVSYGLIRSLHNAFGMPVLPAKLLAEGTLFLGNFAILREFVFARRREANS